MAFFPTQPPTVMILIVPFMLTSILVVVTMQACYLLACAVAAHLFRKRKPVKNRFLNIGVVIPAHNEEKHIARTIGTLLESDYPANRYELLVIADNCTDCTAEAARQAGAEVFERSDRTAPGKGFALDWFLKNCRKHYAATDAIVIINADVSVDRDFLSEISASLSNPDIHVVQAFAGPVKPKTGQWSAFMTATLNNFACMRSSGAFHLAGTALLNGNGMGVKTRVLDHYGWPCHSSDGIMEFNRVLLQHEIMVDYNPDAVVMDSAEPANPSATLTGRLSLKLLWSFMLTGHPRVLFALADLSLPSLPRLVMTFGAGTCCAVALGTPWLFMAGFYWIVLLFSLVTGHYTRLDSISG
ncbi:MAG: glycosyltransferase [Chlorobiaceae bacterium]|nr:glycosyltransferase [Chlorobiaceae bacterium]NTW74010.1 glycosyltransferase [Chlorobiaceae bacterium]